MSSQGAGETASLEAVRDSYSRSARPPVAEYADLAAELTTAVDGHVRFDEYAQILYASDGSIYQARPAGVVEAKHEADVIATVTIAAEHNVPVMARGAGSSLSGQGIGPGCVIIDTSTYMNEILAVDPDEKRATVQPGVVQDHLDAHLAQWDLKFAPDPASSNRATIGGGIGNNSTGAHSVRYGITDAYTESLRVVLGDGEVIETREVVLDSAEWDTIIDGGGREAELYAGVRAIVEENTGEIETRYPDLKRCVSGYNLDRVIYENAEEETVINLSRLIVGAESTLGIVTEATLELVSQPESTALVLYCFEELLAALRAVPVALEHPVSAVELMDAEVFRLARESEGYAEYAEAIPENAGAALMLEFDSELVGDFSHAIAKTDSEFLNGGEAFEAMHARREPEQARLWTLRKAAIPLLMSLEGDPKPYPFIEDATVPPEELARYVEGFEAILEEHGTSAAYFAHAGAGTLHIRPILNLKDEDDIQTMWEITDAVTDLVLEHHGAFSGEHGDGMARTEFTPKMYGQALWNAFKEIKTLFDPDWQLHPGNVVYRESSKDPGPDSDRGVDADMRTNLRYGPAYQSIRHQSTLDFEPEGGFSHLIELCNGCGTCRQSVSDVMCPTYRASSDELLTTRGRANMLRAAISGEIDPDHLDNAEFHREVLDLCVGCKGCKTDCPTGVDLAKLKAEVKHAYHQRNGTNRRSQLFANIDRLASLGSTTAPISNWMSAVPGARAVMGRVLGIAPERSLPAFTRSTLFDRLEGQAIGPAPDATEHRVLFFPDTYSVYVDPAPALAAIRTLAAAGVHVRVDPDFGPSGRAAYSVGRLDLARERAEAVLELTTPLLEEGWAVVGVEPSDVVMFQDEYRDLLPGAATERLAAQSFDVFAYLDQDGLDTQLDVTPLDEHVVYHGHCHQHAAGTDRHVTTVLDRAGFAVTMLDSGCCGMAGSFGYEAEHFDLSKAIAQRLFDQITALDPDHIVATGTSCRHQLDDWEHREWPVSHPIELLDAAIHQ